jgi:transcription-repair coupling factor (superfamily II helicase)
VTIKKRVTPSAQFDEASTQQVAVAEIIGDIEERMALDRIGK